MKKTKDNTENKTDVKKVETKKVNTFKKKKES